MEPTNSYAVSKAAASIALRQWAEEHQLTLEILRVFHVFGEGESQGRFWPSLRRAALAGEDFQMTAGEQIRDFLNVADVASAFLDRATAPSSHIPAAKIFNLSSGKPLTILAFAQCWWKLWEAKGQLLAGALPYRPGEVMRYVAGPNLIVVSRG